MTADLNDPDRLVPLTAYKAERVRRQVKVAAALTGKTMSAVLDECFDLGFAQYNELHGINPSSLSPAQEGQQQEAV